MTLVKFKQHPAQGNLNNLVDSFFSGFPSMLQDDFGKGLKQSVPVNIKETEEGYVLNLVAPGYAKEDFKIDLEQETLTIAGEMKNTEASQTEKVIRTEYKFQSFKRSFTIDATIDADKISAEYVNGVLTLNLPKKAEVKPATKQINIQ